MRKIKLSLSAKILMGMFFGACTGLLLQTFLQNGNLSAPWITAFFIDGVFRVGGEVFIASLMMLVVPLVFVSLVCGTSALSDISTLGKLGIKSLSLYIMTTAIAITIAIALALYVSPGHGVELTPNTQPGLSEAPSLADVVINMMPRNPFQSMAEGNMLQIIVFSVLFGIAIAMVGARGKVVASFFSDLNTIIMQLVLILMKLAPYGIFCLMARIFSELSWHAIGSLAQYFFVVMAALFAHALIVYPLLLKVFAGLNPITFYKKIRSALLFGFSTSSSSATLPVTMEVVTNRLGVHNSVSSFTLPLGATINMDGTAIMQGVATVFIAQVYGIDLSLTDYLMVILTATLASIGTAGVPGVGLIMLAMVLQQVGLPVEGIALIIGVDRLLDMTRTAVNISGDATISCIVAKSESKLDQARFYSTSPN
ncbi:dicarboxylate/amino acid:cation symporter [Alkalimonas sp. MEB108]|uniref:Dicarboxylate/amino acid:cation symporter n=1 Tax=Alkalimonas cellulosilytica TaxID=3058395 RepID=A0ABU7JA31_9GAMM|nr:dicarboxylate/amino acid:cation symporter [Alkalimonas sp. MEB108]MEE2003404.1 dicarboxylate/amino acid:cation symporter [Alkalimonas sp. MEB108]